MLHTLVATLLTNPFCARFVPAEAVTATNGTLAVKLWIDNTGLQSAGLCLEGRASPATDNDPRGLLQLATLIAFGNEISLNEFEHGDFQQRTISAIELLKNVGIDENIINVAPITEKQYARACQNAAEEASKTLKNSFNPDVKNLLGLEPAERPRATFARQIRFVDWVRFSKVAPDFAEVKETALSEKGIGAVEYMISCSPVLRDVIYDIINMSDFWDDDKSYNLMMYLRYCLNQSLAKNGNHIYSPAVTRASLICQQNDYIVSLVVKEIDDIVRELRSVPLGIPSTFEFFLNKSKGDPKGIVETALEIRNFTGPLRDKLQKISYDLNAESSREFFEARKEIKELGAQLRRDTKLKGKARFIDAVSITFVFGIPTVKLSGKDLLEWIVQMRNKRRNSVLTDIARTAVLSNSGDQYYKNLRISASANVK